MSVQNWTAGTVGRVYTHHKSDGKYSASAELVDDCPADNIHCRVRLIEDFYCLGAGEELTTERRLFRPLGELL